MQRQASGLRHRSSADGIPVTSDSATTRQGSTSTTGRAGQPPPPRKAAPPPSPSPCPPAYRSKAEIVKGKSKPRQQRATGEQPNGGEPAARRPWSATRRSELGALGSSAGESRGGGLASHLPPPAHSSGAIGRVGTIHSDMAVDELWDTIRRTVPERKLFALFGLILAEQPTHVSSVSYCYNA